jgi:trehalose synthase-fused probable maltokinase
MASRPLRSDPAAVVALLSGPGRSDFAQFLARQRWFAAKTRGVGTLAVRDWAILDAEGPLVLLLLDVDGDRYHVPVTVAADAPAGAALARLDGESVVDAHDDPRFGRRVLAAIAAGRRLAGQAGRVSFHPTPGWSFPPDPDAVPARRHPGEQSNTSVMLGTGLVLKTLRRPQPGLNPDLEITRFLTTRTRFRHVPRLAGWSEYEGPEGTATLAVLQEFVVNGGDGWKHVVGALRARVAAGSLVGAPDPARDPLIADVRRLGAITGGLHAALASDGSDPDFAPEPVTREDVTRWAADIRRDAETATRPGATGEQIGLGEAGRAGIARAVGALEALVGTVKIRSHGDYHLGQVLKTPDGFAIIDFEGEPARPLAERRVRQSALRDVAGMLRSLDYAAHAVAFGLGPDERAPALGVLTAWEGTARRAFLAGYREAVAESPAPLVPSTEGALLGACGAFELEKACYELRYERDNRPDWVAIPLAGIRRFLTP